MTFAAVGTIISSATTTFSLTPGGIGDFILFEVINAQGGVVYATSLSSSNVTWTTLGTLFLGTTNAMTAQVFFGTVTSTSAQTVTIAWSGSTPGSIEAAGQEFSTTAGVASVALDVQGHIDVSGTSTWASLTPNHGAGELYFGFANDSGTASNGSTSGYVYQSVSGNGMAYNVSCANSAQAPVWGDSGQQFGIMVLAYEMLSTGPPLNQGLLPNFPAIITSNAGWRSAGHSR